MTDEAKKPCIACGIDKVLSDFYKHPNMADGHLNRCKECQKQNTKNNYQKRGGRTDYERERERSPERRAAKAAHQRAYRRNNPDKIRARCAVSNALRDGRLVKKPCEVCGTTDRVQAHHHDYSKPLDVKWLCFTHHTENEHGKKVRCL